MKVQINWKLTAIYMFLLLSGSIERIKMSNLDLKSSCTIENQKSKIVLQIALIEEFNA